MFNKFFFRFVKNSEFFIFIFHSHFHIWPKQETREGEIREGEHREGTQISSFNSKEETETLARHKPQKNKPEISSSLLFSSRFKNKIALLWSAPDLCSPAIQISLNFKGVSPIGLPRAS